MVIMAAIYGTIVKIKHIAKGLPAQNVVFIVDLLNRQYDKSSEKLHDAIWLFYTEYK